MRRSLYGFGMIFLGAGAAAAGFVAVDAGPTIAALASVLWCGW
jgi:hypothetical protein